MIEKAPQEDVFISETIWCHGWARNKIWCHYQLLKQSILQWVVIVLNSYGWKNFFMNMGFLKTPCAFFMTIQVPLIYPKTLFNIQSQSILKFDIISFETWWKRKLYGWSSSTPTIKRLIFSLNHLMVLGLNLFIGLCFWFTLFLLILLYCFVFECVEKFKNP